MWTRKLSIENLGLAGKRVLMRVDYNVPIHSGKIANNSKIISSLDSIVYALVKDAKSVVLMTHLGKPKGIKNMRFSLSPVAEELDSLLKMVHKDPKSLGKYSEAFKLYSSTHQLPNVKFFSDCIGSEIEDVCKDPPHGSIFLLENLRFHLEEEGIGLNASGNKVISTIEKTKTFKQSLCKLGDFYINDAFSLTNRTYSSILGEGFDKRAAGLMLNKEIRYFTKAINKPKKPFLAILGGITIIDKLHLIDNLLDKVSEMIIAGAMAFPFLKKLRRMQTGHSLFDVEGCKVVNMIMKKAKQKRVYIHFPVDFMTSSRLGKVRFETIKSGIEEEWMGLDIGPESCSIFRKVILKAKTIVWNGPPGAYELDNFRAGTESVLLDVAKATSRGATSVIVGEDTAACVSMWHQENNVSHVSSGANAAKDILRGKVLPGVAALSDNNELNVLELKLN